MKIDQLQHVKDMLNSARTTYISWMLNPTNISSEILADSLSKLADELDITEIAALELVKGNGQE